MRRITLLSSVLISIFLLTSCRNVGEKDSSSSDSLVSTQEVSSISQHSSSKETAAVSTTSTSETRESVVDTSNLSADQMKQWVAAIWRKRTNVDLLQDSKYEIILETKEDQLLYARVEAADVQIDTLDVFRVNSDGFLEEAGYYLSQPDQDWIVVSKKYLDTSMVERKAPAEETSQQGGPSDHERAEMVRTTMQQNQGFDENVLAAIPDEEILAANAGNATNSQIAQTADNLLKKYPELQQP
ncbi:hypothetical protein [Enterococcus sp. AZ072]|uniref:hypothetical protein n=1 Tax=unclassified Enterococcus TaxID=2608891 RepID=UPI003D27F214